MFDPKTMTFDIEKMTEFFRSNEFTRRMGEMKLPGMDMDAVMAAQQKNMEALVKANKAAAAGYQDLFRRQVAIFEETMAEVQKHMKAFDTTQMDSETARKQQELAKAAFEKALSNMQQLAELAHKANSEAYEIVSARVQDSIRELRELSAKAAGK